jgi:hypothetical protein
MGKMLSSKNYLITFALGYNPELEKLVKNERYVIIERVAPTRWRQIETKGFGNYKYHSPWYAGNAVCILTNLEDLQFEFVTRNWLCVLSRCRSTGWSWKNFLKAGGQERSDRKKHS